MPIERLTIRGSSRSHRRSLTRSQRNRFAGDGRCASFATIRRQCRDGFGLSGKTIDTLYFRPLNPFAPTRVDCLATLLSSRAAKFGLIIGGTKPLVVKGPFTNHE